MTRQLEQVQEEKNSKRNNALLLALEGGLARDVARGGADLLGFSVKLNGGDCLIILRASLAGRQQISFVGATDFPEGLLKACREGRSDKLKWREDKYAGG